MSTAIGLEIELRFAGRTLQEIYFDGVFVHAGRVRLIDRLKSDVSKLP